MEESQHHPNYLLIGAALIVLTFFEVVVVGLPIPPLPFLLLFGGAKALLIALYFMHLKFDRRLYALMFSLGAILGIAMIFVLVAIIQSRLT